MHATGEYSISDLFSVSRPTGYCTLNRRGPLTVRSCPLPDSTPQSLRLECHLHCLHNRPRLKHDANINHLTEPDNLFP